MAHRGYLLAGFVAFLELALQPGHRAEFGRADRGEILGVGKQDRVTVADPVVEMNGALCRLGGKIGGRHHQ